MYNQVDTENLKSAGFVNVGGRGILSDREIKQLQDISNKLLVQFEDKSPRLDETSDYQNAGCGEGAVVLTRFSQHDPLISKSINKILSDKSIKATLNSILGLDYKIWSINLRRSSSGDKGLCFHQDSLGETNMVILLEDNSTRDGATLFFPGDPSVVKNSEDAWH